MRIHGSLPPTIERASTDAASGAAKTEPKDAAVVSPGAREAHASTERQSAAHAARVASIAAAVQGGTYQIDHAKLADKIISDELARRGSE